jgi:acyl dehydratase
VPASDSSSPSTPPAAETAGTFDALQPGDRWTSPEFALGEDAAGVTAWAGYTFALFTDEAFARQAGFPGRPVPGELILLLLGGLAEQTGVFDESTLALTGLESVHFKQPCVVGDSIHLEMEVIRKELSGSGRRGFITFAWTCFNQRGDPVLEAEATLAFLPDGAAS